MTNCFRSLFCCVLILHDLHIVSKNFIFTFKNNKNIYFMFHKLFNIYICSVYRYVMVIVYRNTSAERVALQSHEYMQSPFPKSFTRYLFYNHIFIKTNKIYFSILKFIKRHCDISLIIASIGRVVRSSGCRIIVSSLLTCVLWINGVKIEIFPSFIISVWKVLSAHKICVRKVLSTR